MRNRSAQTKIITFASSKGGVGKSTSCAALAGALIKRGQSLVILDLDQNQTLYRWFQKHNVRGLNVEPATPDTFQDSIRRAREKAPGFILIDVAGAYEATIIKAIAVSDLVITPSKLSEPDLREAAKILSEVQAFNSQFGSNIQHRLLINEADSLDPHYQRHILGEVDRSALCRFQQLMMRRAPYREIFISGTSPHQADEGRGPVKKAIVELDALTEELLAALSKSKKDIAA